MPILTVRFWLRWKIEEGPFDQECKYPYDLQSLYRISFHLNGPDPIWSRFSNPTLRGKSPSGFCIDANHPRTPLSNLLHKDETNE